MITEYLNIFPNETNLQSNVAIAEMALAFEGDRGYVAA